MFHPPFSLRPRSITVSGLLAALALIGCASAHAAGFGETVRFGEPAPNVGKGEFFVGGGKIAPSFKHLIGVDSADNSVFILEEPRQEEEIESGAQEGEFRHWYRVQKFGPEGKFRAQSQTFELVTTEQEEEEGEETEQDVQGIAIDAEAEHLYFLVNQLRHEKRTDEETETAAYLFELSTKTLEGAPGTSNGVLAGPEKLLTDSKEIAKPLLEPRGLTVDPKRHEAVMLAKEDAKAEEKYHWVLQRITSAGAFGERYVDNKDFLAHPFEVSGVKLQGGRPSSPVVTAAGKTLVEDSYEVEVKKGETFVPEAFVEIAEIPAEFDKATASNEEPSVLFKEARPAAGAPNRVAEAEGYEFGGSLSVSPEGTLYQHAGIENAAQKGALRPGLLLRSASTGSVTGWTGGQAQSATSDACVIEPGVSESPLPIAAAGKEGKVYVLAAEYLKPAGEGLEEFKTHAAVIGFGPGGSGCPTDSSSAVIAKEGNTPVTEPQQGLPVTLSEKVTQGDVLSATWTIEHEGKKEEPPFTSQRFAEASIQHTFAQSGEYKVTVKLTTDDLAGPQEFEQSQTFKVKGEAEAPKCTESPKDLTAPAGSEAVFKAAASGPPDTTEWKVSKDGGKTFESDTLDVGHNTNTLRVKAAKALDGDQYEAVFKNAKGQAVCGPAVLHVTTEAPAVTEQPANRSVTEGSNASFKAAAKGAPPPTVQWEVSANGGASWSPMAGKTSGTLTLTGTTTAQSGSKYRAVFTGEPGQTATSNPATLTVAAAAPPPEESPPPGGGGVLPHKENKPAPPKATIAGATFKVTPAGALSVKVSCPSGASTCIGTIVIKTASAVSASAGTANKKKAILTLASGSFTIGGGQTKVVTLHLSGKARALLARLHTLKVRATVSAHDPANDRETTVQGLTLKATIKHKKH